jgi:hypothetical protein
LSFRTIRSWAEQALHLVSALSLTNISLASFGNQMMKEQRSRPTPPLEHARRYPFELRFNVTLPELPVVEAQNGHANTSMLAPCVPVAKEHVGCAHFEQGKSVDESPPCSVGGSEKHLGQM